VKLIAFVIFAALLSGQAPATVSIAVPPISVTSVANTTLTALAAQGATAQPGRGNFAPFMRPGSAIPGCPCANVGALFAQIINNFITSQHIPPPMTPALAAAMALQKQHQAAAQAQAQADQQAINAAIASGK